MLSAHCSRTSEHLKLRTQTMCSAPKPSVEFSIEHFELSQIMNRIENSRVPAMHDNIVRS